MARRDWDGFLPLVILTFVMSFLTTCITIFGFVTGHSDLPQSLAAAIAFESHVRAMQPQEIYKTSVFSIEYPEGWEVKEESTSTKIQARFSGKNNRNEIIVLIFEGAENLTGDQLTDMLKQYLDENYGHFELYSQGSPFIQSDGSIEITSTYNIRLHNGDIIRIMLDSYIEQRNNMISILTIAIREDQFEELRDPITNIVNSYRIDHTAHFVSSP